MRNFQGFLQNSRLKDLEKRLGQIPYFFQVFQYRGSPVINGVKGYDMSKSSNLTDPKSQMTLISPTVQDKSKTK